MSKSTTPERLARVEEWQSNHENRCEERYAGIQSDVRGIRGTIWKAALSLIGLLITGLGAVAYLLWQIVAAKVGLP